MGVAGLRQGDRRRSPHGQKIDFPAALAAAEHRHTEEMIGRARTDDHQGNHRQSG